MGTSPESQVKDPYPPHPRELIYFEDYFLDIILLYHDTPMILLNITQWTGVTGQMAETIHRDSHDRTRWRVITNVASQATPLLFNSDQGLMIMMMILLYL